jgi:CHAD domain-containing protein
MIDRLESRADHEIGTTPKASLLRALRLRRRAVQPRLRKKLERIGTGELKRQFASVQNKIRWRGQAAEPDWQNAAIRMLGQVAAELYAAGKPLEGEGENGNRIEEIHRLRICGKQLRYTMEITVGAIGRPLRELYDFVEKMQTRLGTINDHAVALDFYQMWDDCQSDPATWEAIKSVIRSERDGLQAALQDFTLWWSDQHVGQFWQRWQDVVGPLPPPPPTDTQDDSPIQKKGA